MGERDCTTSKNKHTSVIRTHIINNVVFSYYSKIEIHNIKI